MNADRIFNNFISVENIFEFLRTLEIRKKFDIINIASTKEKTLGEVVALMKKRMNSKSKIVISKKKRNFFNLSTEKAQREYGFIPHGAGDGLMRWIEEKVQNES